MPIDSTKKSSRLLQSRRYTHDSFTDAQEAFTSVLDINANEVFTDQNLIPTASLPFSGSSQSGSVYTSNGINVLKYYYRYAMTRSNLVSGSANEVWFLLSPTGSAAGIGAQIIDANQQTNFVSPKYALPTLANSTAEDTPAGYLAKVFVSSNATTPSNADVVSVNNYAFDYKSGVLQFSTNALAATTSQYVYITVYQYVGRTLGTSLGSLTGSFSGSFFGNGSGLTNISASAIVGLNLFQIATGSVTASVNTGPNIFTVASSSTAVFNLTNSGSITINATGSVPHFFLITSGSKNVFKINNEGAVENKVFEGGYIPTPQYGAIYFTSQSVFVGLDQVTFN